MDGRRNLNLSIWIKEGNREVGAKMGDVAGKGMWNCDCGYTVKVDEQNVGPFLGDLVFILTQGTYATITALTTSSSSSPPETNVTLSFPTI